MNVQHQVPAYSQHLHIKDKKWRKKSCGIVSLAMLLEYFGKKDTPDNLLKLGLEMNAYLPGIGWKHKGLADLAKNYGLSGKSFDWAKLDSKIAFQKLKNYLEKYPILVSIHLNFNPEKNGHLIVLVGLEKDKIFYNEPNIKKNIRKSVSFKKFLTGWKKRIIVISQ